MAIEAYVAIQGKVQGAFRGNNKPGSSSPIISFQYELQAPRDASTGQASGKRQYAPITILKEWGVSAPQLYQALVSNEVLTSVVIQLIDPHSPKRVSQTFHLTDATVLQMHHIGDKKHEVTFVSHDVHVTRGGVAAGPMPIPYPN